MLLLSNNVHDYYFVSQGKTTIPGLDDGEELFTTDVSASLWPVKHFSAQYSRLNDSLFIRENKTEITVDRILYKTMSPCWYL